MILNSRPSMSLPLDHAPWCHVHTLISMQFCVQLWSSFRQLFSAQGIWWVSYIQVALTSSVLSEHSSSCTERVEFMLASVSVLQCILSLIILMIIKIRHGFKFADWGPQMIHDSLRLGIKLGMCCKISVIIVDDVVVVVVVVTKALIAEGVKQASWIKSLWMTLILNSLIVLIYWYEIY